MKRLFPILVLLIVLALAAGRVAPDHGVVEVEVQRLKSDLVQAYIDRDAAALERIYCDDFTVTDAKGAVRTKQTEIERLGSGPRLLSGRYDAIAPPRVFGEVAVLYGHGKLSGEGEDGPFEASYDSFNVFVRDGDGWCYAAAFVP